MELQHAGTIDQQPHAKRQQDDSADHGTRPEPTRRTILSRHSRHPQMNRRSACSHPLSCDATAIAIAPYSRFATADAISAGCVNTSHMIAPAATVLTS